jgi:hypothetical protein
LHSTASTRILGEGEQLRCISKQLREARHIHGHKYFSGFVRRFGGDAVEICEMNQELFRASRIDDIRDISISNNNKDDTAYL